MMWMEELMHLASEKSEKRMDRIEGTEKPERVSPLWK
jgi:hypothetical protein